MKIYYWKIRGLVQPIVTLCEYLEVPYELVQFESMEEWMAKKTELINEGFHYANLPFIEDEKFLGKERLAESSAIMFHILEHYNGKSMMMDMPKQLQLNGVIGDLKLYLVLNCYYSKNHDELR